MPRSAAVRVSPLRGRFCATLPCVTGSRAARSFLRNRTTNADGARQLDWRPLTLETVARTIRTQSRRG